MTQTRTKYSQTNDVVMIFQHICKGSNTQNRRRVVPIIRGKDKISIAAQTH